MISRMIMHKWHEGDIDGLTLVYSSLIGEWKKISEVAVLKEAISKVAAEEQAGLRMLLLVHVYIYDDRILLCFRRLRNISRGHK